MIYIMLSQVNDFWINPIIIIRKNVKVGFYYFDNYFNYFKLNLFEYKNF